MDRKKTTLAHALSLFVCCSLSNVHAMTIDSQKLDTLLTSSSTSKGTRVGSGYLANARYPMHHCLKHMDVMLSDTMESVSFREITKIEELAKQLSVDVSSNLGWGKFSMSGAADYLRTLESNKYSLHFTFLSSISTEVSLDNDDLYGEGILNPAGLAAYNRGIDDFINLCGDTYIDSLKLGAVLAVTLRINFDNQLQKKNFEASFSGKFKTLTDTYANLTQALHQSGSSSAIEVLAFQAGGNPTHLTSILGGNEDTHHATPCTSNQTDNCRTIIHDITDYAQATGKWEKTGFLKQIQLDDMTLRAASLSPVDLSLATIAPYQAHGITIPDKIISPEAADARKRLIKLHDQSEENASFSEAILASAPYPLLPASTQLELKQLSKTLQDDLTTIRFGGSLKCFLPNTQEDCPQIMENIERQITSPDVTKLNHLRGAYYVNINERWPLLFVEDINNDNNSMQLYDLIINPVAINIHSHSLAFTYNSNLGILAPRGGYSLKKNNNETRYYLDHYGQENWLRQDSSGIGYFGKTPWNTCINGTCSKAYNTMYVVPF